MPSRVNPAIDIHTLRRSRTLGEGVLGVRGGAFIAVDRTQSRGDDRRPLQPPAGLTDPGALDGMSCRTLG